MLGAIWWATTIFVFQFQLSFFTAPLFNFFPSPPSIAFLLNVDHLDVVTIRIEDKGCVVTWNVVPFSRCAIVLRACFPINRNIVNDLFKVNPSMINDILRTKLPDRTHPPHVCSQPRTPDAALSLVTRPRQCLSARVQVCRWSRGQFAYRQS